jgi:hypothetical protein
MHGASQILLDFEVREEIDPMKNLSFEERRIMQLIRKGRENAMQVADIAADTDMDSRTVRAIVKDLIEKHHFCIGSSIGSPAEKGAGGQVFILAKRQHPSCPHYDFHSKYWMQSGVSILETTVRICSPDIQKSRASKLKLSARRHCLAGFLLPIVSDIIFHSRQKVDRREYGEKAYMTERSPLRSGISRDRESDLDSSFWHTIYVVSEMRC